MKFDGICRICGRYAGRYTVYHSDNISFYEPCHCQGIVNMTYYIECDSEVKRLATIKYLMEIGYPLVTQSTLHKDRTALESRNMSLDFARWPCVAIYNVDSQLKGSRKTYVDFCSRLMIETEKSEKVLLQDIPVFKPRKELTFDNKKVIIGDDEISINSIKIPKDIFTSLKEHNFPDRMVVSGNREAIGMYLQALGYRSVDSTSWKNYCANFSTYNNIVVNLSGSFDLTQADKTVKLEEVPIPTYWKTQLLLLTKEYLYLGGNSLLTNAQYKEVLAAL
jgi:hypothetical protein